MKNKSPYTYNHTKSEPTNLKEFYSNLYQSNQNLICENVGSAVNAARTDALEKFRTISRGDKYKHIDIQKIFAADYERYFTAPISQANEAAFSCDVSELESCKIIVFNGFYCNDGERLTQLSNGVVYGSFAEASKKYPEIFEQYYNKIADNDSENLVALNTAFAQDGIFIHVPANVVLDKPIQIINIVANNKPAMVQYRNLFVIDECAQADILICDHTMSDSVFLTNNLGEIFVERNAKLNIVRLQNEHNHSNHFSHFYTKQADDSHYTENTLTLNGGTVCNNINILLAGEGCESHAYGAFLVDKEQNVANYTLVNHAVPNCTSHELFKGILDDNATGIFKGKIYVSPYADKTQAYQSNNNILLTNSAKVFTRPQLEIYADDVKCSHGATIGQLDEEALFYMRARGIAEKEAKLLQLHGFVNDVIRKINIQPLRERVAELVSQRLRGELSMCVGCAHQCRK